MEKRLTEVTQEERPALRDGRKLEELYTTVKALINNLRVLRLDGISNVGFYIEKFKSEFESGYDQIMKIEQKYFNRYRELVGVKQRFDELHKEACYYFASKCRCWGKS
jgi:hypothetical protein